MARWLALFLLLSGSASSAALPGAYTQPFQSDLRQPLNLKLWEGDIYPGEESLCMPTPPLLWPSKDGLRFVIKDVGGLRGNCGYGGLRSKHYCGYGTFTVRMKAPIKPGEVGCFFLINQWQPKNWLQKEIDIEFLGKDRRGVQFNTHRFQHGSGNMTGDPKWVSLGFDAGADFHDWSIRWEPGKATWSVDGKALYVSRTNIPDEPLMIMCSLWAPNPALGWPAHWCGVLDRKQWPDEIVVQSISYKPL